MRKELRAEIYQRLLENMKYDENAESTYETHKCDYAMKMREVVKKVDGASYGNKVKGNSLHAALYLASKFHGYVIQKTHNERIVYCYVLYADDKGNLMAANPLKDLKRNSFDQELNFDIPFEKFKTNKLLQMEIGIGNKIVCNDRSDNLYFKVHAGLYAHNYLIENGKFPTYHQMRKEQYEDNHIPKYIYCENSMSKK